jgi:RNA polymerase sigma-70 factor (ECF subfamily)
LFDYKNRSLNCLRNKRLHQDIISNVSENYDREIDIRINTLESCDPQEIFSIEIHKIIAQTIKSLPPLTQQIFEMSRYDCLSVKEIAQAKRLSEKGVEYHITKALKGTSNRLERITFLFSTSLFRKISSHWFRDFLFSCVL